MNLIQSNIFSIEHHSATASETTQKHVNYDWFLCTFFGIYQNNRNNSCEEVTRHCNWFDRKSHELIIRFIAFDTAPLTVLFCNSLLAYL